MYCSSCGAKISKDGKFCPKCGTKVIQAQTEEIAKSSHFSWKQFFGLTLIAMIAASAAVYAVSNRQSQLQTPLIVISSILSGILIIWIVIAVLKSLFKLSVSTFTSSKNLVLVFLKHPVIGTLIVAAFAILIFIVNFYVSDYEYKQMQKTLGPIQDQGTEVAVAKSNKDSYSAKLISDRLSKLATARRLNDYKLAIKLWADVLAKSGSAADDPGAFVLNLTVDQTQDAFKVALSQIVQTKEFGDDAIKRGDRKTMRFVAAKLLIQGHWLQGIAQSADPGFLSLHPSIVFAADGIRPKIPIIIKKRNPCLTTNKRVCLNDVTKIIQGIYRSALGYGVGDKDATKEWNTNWTDASPILQTAGQPQGGTGITQGDKDQPQNPPAVQAFLDECKAKGGYIGGGVKERLPTTEDGRTCRYQQDKCWDFLTYSGGRYKGGNPGCEEQGLLPKPPPPPAPKNNQTNRQNQQQQNIPPPVNSNSWDGVYQVTTNINCSHDAPFEIPGIDHLSPFSDTITVRNNSIINPNGGSYPIGSSKQVTIPFQTDAGVGVSLSFNQTFNFFPTGDGGAGVNGQISIQAHSSVETVNFNLNCNGSFSGRRVSQ